MSEPGEAYERPRSGDQPRQEPPPGSYREPSGGGYPPPPPQNYSQSDQGYQPPGHGYPPPGGPGRDFRPAYDPSSPQLRARPGSDDIVMAVLAHLSVFVLPLIGPLIIYLIKKDTSPYARAQSAEALNWHITLTIATIVSGILVIILIGLLLLIAVGIVSIVFAIIAAVASGKGENYRYPINLRLVS